jgi:hypothetical protein
MTPTFVCSGYCGITGAAATGFLGHLIATGAPAIETTNVRTAGTTGIRINPAGAAKNVKHDHGGTSAVERFFIRFTTRPTAVATLMLIGESANAHGYLVYNPVTNKFNLSFNGSVANTDVGPVVSAGQFYEVNLAYDVSANPHTLKATIDEGTEVAITNAVAAGTVNTTIWGTDGAHTYDAVYQDMLSSQTYADYPLQAGHVRGYVPTSTGTHNQTAGDFIDHTGASITNGDGSWAEIDEQPGDTATYVAQGPTRTTSYAEYLYGTGSVTEIPRAVEQVVGFFNATAASASHKCQLYDGTSAADMYATTSFLNSTVAYISVQWATPPSGGSWTLTKFQSLRIRFGFSGDATPDPRLTTTIIEAEFSDAAVAKSAIDSGTGAETSTTTDRAGPDDAATLSTEAATRTILSGTVDGTASVTGGGTLGATAVLILPGTLAATGGATVSLAATLKLGGTIAATGGGTVGASAILKLGATLAVTGGGALAADAITKLAATAALAGGATLGATGSIQLAGSLALAGSGAVGATPSVKLAGSSALAGGVTLVAPGGVRVPADAAVTGGGTLGATGKVTLAGAAALAGAGDISPNGVLRVAGTLTLSGAGVLSSSAGTMTYAGAAPLVGGADLVPEPDPAVGTLRQGTAALVGGASYAVTGRVVLSGGAAMTAGATTNIDGRLVRAGALAAVGGGSLSADGLILNRGTAALAGSASAAFTGALILPGDADLEAQSDWQFDGLIVRSGTATLAGAAVVNAAGAAREAADAALASGVALDADGSVVGAQESNLAVGTLLGAEGVVIRLSAATLAGSFVLLALNDVSTGASADLRSETTLTADARRLSPLRPGTGARVIPRGPIAKVYGSASATVSGDRP